MADHLAALGETDDRAERESHIAALVDCPQPLAPLLSRLAGDAGALVEAMTRRYYRIRPLEGTREQLLDGVPFVLSTYEREGRRHHVAATLGEPDELPAALRALAAHARTLPAGEPLLADVYALRSQPEDLDGLLADAELPDAVARVVFVRAPEAADGAVDVRTYARDGDGGLAEDPTVRGMHPMMAERLDVWRLREFDLERLPSAQDVYLFRAVAHANPRDERLVALAEVRDLTPVRDESGRITALPELERMVRESFEAMRTVQARRPARKRLHWNRLLLYAWPPMDFAPGRGERDHPPLHAHGRRARPRDGPAQRAHARGRRGARPRAAHLQPRRPRRRRRARRSRRPPRCSRSTRARSGSSPRAAAAACTRRRSSRCSPRSARSRARRSRPASSSSTTSTGDGRLVPVDRPPATNRASIVVGLVRNRTERHPEGMRAWCCSATRRARSARSPSRSASA